MKAVFDGLAEILTGAFALSHLAGHFEGNPKGPRKGAY
jgi:hypothetical protein